MVSDFLVGTIRSRMLVSSLCTTNAMNQPNAFPESKRLSRDSRPCDRAAELAVPPFLPGSGTLLRNARSACLILAGPKGRFPGQIGGSRAMPATSHRHVARLLFESVGALSPDIYCFPAALSALSTEYRFPVLRQPSMLEGRSETGSILCGHDYGNSGIVACCPYGA